MQKALLILAFAACATTDPESKAPASSAPIAKASKVGDKVPMFSGKDRLTAETIGLVPGKVNLVWLWATWSIDNKAMPHVAPLQRRYGERLNIVLVSMDDDPKEIPNFLQQNGGAELHSIWDGDDRELLNGPSSHRIARELLATPCAPTWYVIDKAGVIRHIMCGYPDGSIEREIEPECKKLF